MTIRGPPVYAHPMQVVGTLVILTGLAIAAWTVIRRPHHPAPPVLWLAGLAIIAGLGLVVQDRLIGVSLKGVGTIKAAARQATTDAEHIKKMRERIDAQGAAIDAVAQQAVDARRASRDLGVQADLADKKLKAIDDAQQKATRLLSELQETAKFMETAQAALNDDRVAYDRLRALAADKTSPFSERATQTLRTVLDKHSPVFARPFTILPWQEGIEPSKE